MALPASACGGAISLKSLATPPRIFWASPLSSNKKGDSGSGPVLGRTVTSLFVLGSIVLNPLSHLFQAVLNKLFFITIASNACPLLTCADKLLTPSTNVLIGFLFLPINLWIINLSTFVTSVKLLTSVPINFLLALSKLLLTELVKNSGTLPNFTVPGLTLDAVIKPLSIVAFFQVWSTNFSNTSSPNCPGSGFFPGAATL